LDIDTFTICCSCQVAKALASEKQIRFAPFADGKLTEVRYFKYMRGKGARVIRSPRVTFI